jgi:hypothetical protein
MTHWVWIPGERILKPVSRNNELYEELSEDIASKP